MAAAAYVAISETFSCFLVLGMFVTLLAVVLVLDGGLFVLLGTALKRK
jgi:hypothetical protein